MTLTKIDDRLKRVWWRQGELEFGSASWGNTDKIVTLLPFYDLDFLLSSSSAAKAGHRRVSGPESKG